MSTNTEALQLKLALSGMAQVEAGFKQLAHEVEHFGEKIHAVAEVALALAGLHEFKEKAHEVLELGSALNVLKLRVGATIPELMAMRKLLSENGGSADDVSVLMRHMQSSIVEAAE